MSVTGAVPVLSELSFRALPLEPAVDVAIAEWCQRDGVGRVYRFLNAYTIALAESDQKYRQVLLESSLNHPDGRPLAPLLTLLSEGGRYSQVRGPDFFTAALKRGVDHRVRHFFLGGGSETLRALTDQVRRIAPGVMIAGSYSPPFGPRDPEEVARQDRVIEEAAPDIVWVGLGTPKQDVESARLAAALGVNVAAVGAAFDFTAGVKGVAPHIVRRLGLEWLFRLASEPRRLWWR